MSVFNTLSACVIITALTGCSLYKAEQSATISRAGETDPAIHFSETGEEDQGTGKEENTCKISIGEEDITASLIEDDYECKNDHMRYFRLVDVRSATYITLRSKYCDESDGWLFTLRTIIDPVQTDWIAIDDLDGYAEGTVVVAGLRMEKKEHTDENTTGKLSCVVIDVSE